MVATLVTKTIMTVFDFIMLSILVRLTPAHRPHEPREKKLRGLIAATCGGPCDDIYPYSKESMNHRFQEAVFILGWACSCS